MMDWVVTHDHCPTDNQETQRSNETNLHRLVVALLEVYFLYHQRGHWTMTTMMTIHPSNFTERRIGFSVMLPIVSKTVDTVLKKCPNSRC